MTLYQIKTLMASKGDLGAGTVHMTADEAASLQLRVQESRRLRGLT